MALINNKKGQPISGQDRNPVIKCYLDHTELKVAADAKSNDTFIMGGLLITREEEIKLCNLMKEIKGRYVHPDLPIKYNMKDLKGKYDEHNFSEKYKLMLNDSAKWRKELFERALEFDFKIVIGVIQNLYLQKDSLKETKSELLGHAFVDILMRIGKELQYKNYKHIQIISDWPESNDPKPFNFNYYYGFTRGTTPKGTGYYCGKLQDIGFHDTVLFASMNHSNMLQFADLIIGASRDFLTAHFDEREYSIGKELTEIILPKFRGFPNNLKYGISISSHNTELKARILKLMAKYVA
jgi:hypothetical protein